VRTFYRVDRVGPPLPDGSVLLVANHPNGILDPAVIQTTAGRQVRFLAKSTLFRRHPLSLFVRHSGAVPIYRHMDAGADTRRNAEMFQAVEAALADGETICLFPEGISHEHGRLEPLRTGAARMALSSASTGHPVAIVPVGLNFEHLAAFRSRVTTVFGAPLEYDDLLSTRGPVDDEAGAVRHLTDRIRENLRRVMVEADPRRDLPLVARVARLYAVARGMSRAPKDRMVRRHLIADGIEKLRQKDPERLDSLMVLLRRYDASLERFGLRDEDVDRRVTARAVARFILREGLLALFLVPLAVAGLVIFWLPYWATGYVSQWAPDLQSRATWRLIGGFLIFGTWIALLAVGVGTQLGAIAALAVAGGLVALAYAGLMAVGREANVLRTISTFFSLRQTPITTRARLKRQRTALATVLEQVGDWLEKRDGTPS
jgi:1-acyl-sn-glycerol-3-phosphate acyltransferase